MKQKKPKYNNLYFIHLEEYPISGNLIRYIVTNLRRQMSTIGYFFNCKAYH